MKIPASQVKVGDQLICGKVYSKVWMIDRYEENSGLLRIHLNTTPQTRRIAELGEILRIKKEQLLWSMSFDNSLKNLKEKDCNE